MKLTIKKILTLPSLKGLKVIAGRGGIDKLVTTATFGEVPGYEYIKNGEFVITTGYFFREDPMGLIDLIVNMKKYGASGLGIKLGRFIDEIPKEVIKVANSLNLPIIAVPIELSASDITSPVQAEIINKQAKRLEFSDKILRLFTNKMILGGNIKNVIDNLSDILQKNVIYYDKYFEEHVIGKFNRDLNMNFDNSRLNKMISTKKSIKIEMEYRTYGYIILSENQQEYNLTDFEKIAIEHASTVIKLQVQKKISNYQIESNYRNEFVQDLITDNVTSLEELNRRGEIYGWNFEKGKIVVVVDIDNFKSQYLQSDDYNPTKEIINIREEIFLDTRKHLKKYFNDIIHGNFSDYMVILLDHGNEDVSIFINKLKETCDKLRKVINKSYRFTVSIGIGKYMEYVKNVHHSYYQAKKAIKLGRIIYGNDNTIYYNELGIFNLLQSIYQSSEAQRFCRDKVGKLIEYDEKHGTNLFENVKVLSKNDWNLKKSSEELFIHYNTMKYRFKRISEILKLDLSNSEQKLNIAISLKLIQMNE
ncbi:MAG: hypothetical protein FH753_12430 [Firmicutes bacterium]|nr:hypothetical protein [Bacillota bacterium]